VNLHNSIVFSADKRPGESQTLDGKKGANKGQRFNTIIQMEAGHCENATRINLPSTGFKQQPICTRLPQQEKKSSTKQLSPDPILGTENLLKTDFAQKSLPVALPFFRPWLPPGRSPCFGACWQIGMN